MTPGRIALILARPSGADDAAEGERQFARPRIAVAAPT
jgi:hypothetical protein